MFKPRLCSNNKLKAISIVSLNGILVNIKRSILLQHIGLSEIGLFCLENPP